MRRYIIILFVMFCGCITTYTYELPQEDRSITFDTGINTTKIKIIKFLRFRGFTLKKSDDKNIIVTANNENYRFRFRKRIRTRVNLYLSDLGDKTEVIATLYVQEKKYNINIKEVTKWWYVETSRKLAKLLYVEFFDDLRKHAR